MFFQNGHISHDGDAAAAAAAAAVADNDDDISIHKDTELTANQPCYKSVPDTDSIQTHNQLKLNTTKQITMATSTNKIL